MNYILKNIDESFWKSVKRVALDQDTTVKAMILAHLERDVEMARAGTWAEFRKLCQADGITENQMLSELIADAVERAKNRKEKGR